MGSPHTVTFIHEIVEDVAEQGTAFAYSHQGYYIPYFSNTTIPSSKPSMKGGHSGGLDRKGFLI